MCKIDQVWFVVIEYITRESNNQSITHIIKGLRFQPEIELKYGTKINMIEKTFINIKKKGSKD